MSPPNYTPLRYPGGKARLGPYLSAVLRRNRLMDGTYAEAYAGGAGAALFLLFRGYTSRVILNDIDTAVTSFWRAVLNQNERFARAIEDVPLTVAEWDRQRKTCASAAGFERGFAFFYLNRTNRSGIMNAGVIGGRQQTGRWRIAARFNRPALAARVRALGVVRRQITIRRADALDFLDELAGMRARRTLVYLDPPYYDKGRDLYTNFYTATDHETIAEYLRSYRLPWLATYDDCEQVRSLYKQCKLLESELSYSAREFRRGRELVIFSSHLVAPDIVNKRTTYTPSFRFVDRGV